MTYCVNDVLLNVRLLQVCSSCDHYPYSSWHRLVIGRQHVTCYVVSDAILLWARVNDIPDSCKVGNDHLIVILVKLNLHGHKNPGGQNRNHNVRINRKGFTEELNKPRDVKQRFFKRATLTLRPRTV